MEWHLGDGDGMALCGDAGVKVGQGFVVGEPADFRHHSVEQIKETVGFRDEGGEMVAPVHRAAFGALVEELTGAGLALGRRQEGERDVIGALEVRAALLERRATLLLHEPGRGFRKFRYGIAVGNTPFGVDE